MTCRRYRKIFSAYLEGDLDSAERHRFENHLKECDQCTAEFTDFKNVVSLTTNLPPIQPSLDFNTSLRAKMAENIGASESRFSLGQRIVVAAGFALVLLIAFFGIRMYSPCNNEIQQYEIRDIRFANDIETQKRKSENSYVNFIMPNVPLDRNKSTELGDVDITTAADWQEGRNFVLPVISDEQEEQDNQKANYIIRRVNLISTSDEIGL